MIVPHWERGHRVHGYWLGDKQIGRVGLTIKYPRNTRIEYCWSMNWDSMHVQRKSYKTLRSAKRAVEREWLNQTHKERSHGSDSQPL